MVELKELEKKGYEVVDEHFQYGFVRVQKKHFDELGFPDSRIGFANEKGKLITPAKYSSNSFNFEGPVARVVRAGKWRLLNTNGKEAPNCAYDYISKFSNGLSSVKLGKKFGYINKKGKVVINLIYDLASNFSENRARVKLNGKYGFIDKRGKTVVDFIYENANDFSEGFAVVKKDGKYGYVNLKGKEAIKCEYDAAFPFHGGVADIKKGDKWGVIDREGNEYFDKKEVAILLETSSKIVKLITSVEYFCRRTKNKAEQKKAIYEAKQKIAIMQKEAKDKIKKLRESSAEEEKPTERKQPQ